MRKKAEAKIRQKRVAQVFGFMLRHWNTGRETDGRYYWIIMREGWPLSQIKPRFERRENLAEIRALQRRWPDCPF